MSKNILVVDDEQDLVQLYEIVLQMAGFVVNGTTSGRKALQEVASNNPDLVLLDVMMPELSGIDVCHQIRQMSLEKQPVIFMYSANDSVENQEKCMAAGADRLISKGVPLDEVTSVIRQALPSETGRLASHGSPI